MKAVASQDLLGGFLQVNGIDSSTGLFTVRPAAASSGQGTFGYFGGFAKAGEIVDVSSEGRIVGALDTTDWSVGDPVYLSDVGDGSMTLSQPAVAQVIGRVADPVLSIVNFDCLSNFLSAPPLESAGYGAGAGLAVSGSNLNVQVDNSTINLSGNQLQVVNPPSTHIVVLEWDFAADGGAQSPPDGIPFRLISGGPFPYGSPTDFYLQRAWVEIVTPIQSAMSLATIALKQNGFGTISGPTAITASPWNAGSPHPPHVVFGDITDPTSWNYNGGARIGLLIAGEDLTNGKIRLFYEGFNGGA